MEALIISLALFFIFIFVLNYLLEQEKNRLLYCKIKQLKEKCEELQKEIIKPKD